MRGELVLELVCVFSNPVFGSCSLTGMESVRVMQR